jgi:protein ImuA
MTAASPLSSDPYPEPPAPLEEACASEPRDMAVLLLFALSRRVAGL